MQTCSQCHKEKHDLAFKVLSGGKLFHELDVTRPVAMRNLYPPHPPGRRSRAG